MDCSPPGFSVHGILQARILQWVAIHFSWGYSQPRDRTHVSCIGRWILYHWPTWEAQMLVQIHREGTRPRYSMESASRSHCKKSMWDGKHWWPSLLNITGSMSSWIFSVSSAVMLTSGPGRGTQRRTHFCPLPGSLHMSFQISLLLNFKHCTFKAPGPQTTQSPLLRAQFILSSCALPIQRRWLNVLLEVLPTGRIRLTTTLQDPSLVGLQCGGSPFAALITYRAWITREYFHHYHQLVTGNTSWSDRHE